ncbi:MAG: acyloxyacyl hydrolase [Fimbriimonadales bacterium]
MLKGLISFLFLVVCVGASADELRDEVIRWRLDFVGHTSAQIAGASEARYGFGVAISASRDARILALRGRRDIESREEISLRAFHSFAAGNLSLPFDALWFTVGGEWTGRGKAFRNLYLELGSGLFLASDTTYDLSSSIDFGSYLGAGMYLGNGGRYAPRVGIRFTHISNAGLRRPNWGVNLVEYTIGFKL